jgi:hypothetical protein
VRGFTEFLGVTVVDQTTMVGVQRSKTTLSEITSDKTGQEIKVCVALRVGCHECWSPLTRPSRPCVSSRAPPAARVALPCLLPLARTRARTHTHTHTQSGDPITFSWHFVGIGEAKCFHDGVELPKCASGMEVSRRNKLCDGWCCAGPVVLWPCMWQ